MNVTRRWLRVLLIAVLWIAGFNQRVLAQETGRLEGQVMAAEDRAALVGANVLLTKQGERRGTTTDAAGHFRFGRVEAGRVTLEVRFMGYRTWEEEVIVPAGQAVSVQVSLRSAPIALAGVEIIGEARDAHRALAGAATKLRPQEIEQIAAVGTQELLSYVPGVHGVADDGMGNSRISVGIRGLSPRRTQRVLVLEDGIPIQPAPYIFSPMYYNPPVERIAEVEVIKGSAAIRHGPQTMGGVINYITSRPHRQSTGGRAHVTTGTHGYVSTYGELGGWGSEVFRPQLQVVAKRGDGFRQNNAFRQLNGTLKLSVMPDSSRTLYLKTNVNYERSRATYTGLTPYSFQIDPAFNPKDKDVYEVFRASASAIYERQLGSRLRSTTKAYANVFDRPWWREKDVFVRAGDYDTGRPADWQPVPWYTAGDLVRVGSGGVSFGNLRTFYVAGLERTYALEHDLFGQDATLEAGTRLHWERFKDDRKRSAAPDDREGIFYEGDPDDPASLNIVGQSHRYETSALAGYALERVDLGRLRLEPGLRLEVFEQERIDRLQGASYRDETSFVVLPGVGFNYAYGRYNLFGGIHRGYTPPSSATLKIVNFGAGPQSSSEDGLDLRSEKSWNTELGLRGALDGVDFEAAAFHLYIEDLVGGRTVFKNLGRVQNYGLELNGTLHASTLYHALPDLHAAYTYLHTEVLEGRIASAVKAGGVEVDIAGNELPYAPRHTLTAGLVKNFGFGLTVRSDLHYVSRVYTDLENLERTSNRGDMGPVPGFAVLDASAHYPINDGLQLQLIVKNVFDEVYIGSRLHSNPRQPQAHLSSGILPGPRRQINLGLRYRY